MRRINLGSGAQPLEGWENWDIKTGQKAFPIHLKNTVDEIRASHILEHFPHAETCDVLCNWVDALKPGGVLKVAVPDFHRIAIEYLAKSGQPTQGFIMGGQIDGGDYHKAIFDESRLRRLMRDAGLRNIRPWVSEIKDCAALPISLNLQGEKLKRAEPIDNVVAVMSIPRLGFMDNFFCSMEALVPLKIPILKFTGVFWGPCLTRVMEAAVERGAKWLLTMDYDSVFTKADVVELMDICARYPKVDALACVQSSRARQIPLFSVSQSLHNDAAGSGTFKDKSERVTDLNRSDTDQEIMQVTTANFGLTLIKVESLLAMQKPWFKGEPDPNGSWGEERIDDDIWFWKQFAASGLRLYLANRVAIGHAQLMIRWPDENMSPIYQHPQEFDKQGKPAGAWR